MIRCFWNPNQISQELPKYGYLISMAYLLATGILLFFTAKIANLTWINSIYVLLGVIITLILGAFALNIILWVWNKNNYLLALNSLLAPWFILATAALLMSILSLIPKVGPILAALIALISIPFAVALQIKIVSENFTLDIITTVVILTILYVAAGTTLMGLIGLLALQLVSQLGFGLLPIAFP